MNNNNTRRGWMVGGELLTRHSVGDDEAADCSFGSSYSTCPLHFHFYLLVITGKV